MRRAVHRHHESITSKPDSRPKRSLGYQVRNRCTHPSLLLRRRRRRRRREARVPASPSRMARRRRRLRGRRRHGGGGKRRRRRWAQKLRQARRQRCCPRRHKRCGVVLRRHHLRRRTCRPHPQAKWSFTPTLHLPGNRCIEATRNVHRLFVLHPATCIRSRRPHYPHQ
jgi:hypothetical protein